MQSIKNDIRKKNDSFFQILRFKFLPYWPSVLILLILFIAGGWFYLKVTPKKFKASASVLINDEKKGADNSQAIESLNIYASKKIVENEIEIIRSKALLLQTIAHLNLCASISYYDGFIFKSAYSLSPIKVEIKDSEKIGEVEMVELKYNATDETVSAFGKQMKLGNWINTDFGLIRFVKNEKVSLNHDGDLFLSFINPKNVLESMLNRLNVSAVSKLSTVIALNYLDEDPQRGVDILNTLIEVYSNAAVADKRLLAENTMRFVEERIAKIEYELDSVESVIQNYKATKGIVDLSEQGKLYLNNVGQNDMRLSDMNMQLAVLNKVEDYVIGKGMEGGLLPSAFGINDPGLSQLVEKLYETEIKYEQLARSIPAGNLIMVSLKKEIDQMRPGILESIRNQRQNLKIGLSNLSQTHNKYASLLNTIPKKERELLEISRQQGIKNNVYTFLLQKREETALSHAVNVGDSRLIDRAISSSKPVSPKSQYIYLGCCSLALLIGISSLSIKGLLTNKLMFREEIDEIVNVPVIGEIPFVNLKDNGGNNNSKNEFLYHQFRQLRFSLGLFGKDQSQVILVSSCMPGDGKTFISSNFAANLSNSVRRVVVVDFDLYRCKLSRNYSMEDNTGIGEYLNGMCSLESIIYYTDNPNLFVIPAGKVNGNPSEILLEKSLQDFFVNLRSRFDYIILDSPPLDPVCDSHIIASYADKSILVLRHGRTSKSVLSLIANNGALLEFPKLGIVFNGIKGRGLIKSHFGYDLGYGYSNSYKNYLTKRDSITA